MTAPDNACPVEQVARAIGEAERLSCAGYPFTGDNPLLNPWLQDRHRMFARAAIDALACQRTLPPAAEVMERETGDVLIGEFVARWYDAADGVMMDADTAQALAREFEQMRSVNIVIADKVREACARVCDMHTDLPLCRELFPNAAGGAFAMASHLATDIRATLFDLAALTNLQTGVAPLTDAGDGGEASTKSQPSDGSADGEGNHHA
jgi:hypothetical protein